MEEKPKWRYVSKLFGNVGNGVLTLLSQIAMTRALGPLIYGQLAFVSSHFEALFGTLDFGCSSSYFTQISQNKKNYPAASTIYLGVVAVITLGIFAYVFIASSLGFGSILWPSVTTSLVWIGIPLGLSIAVYRNGVLVTDAAGLARRVEIVRVLRGILVFGTILALIALKKFTIFQAMWILIIANMGFGIYCVVQGHHVMGKEEARPSSAEVKLAGAQFYSYCQPLIVYTLFSLVAMLADRWILQLVSGSKEQAFLEISTQVGTAIFLTTNALTNIFHRECSVAYGAGNHERVSQLIRTYVPRIFALAAFPALFVAVNSRDFLFAYSGPQFSSGWSTLAVMSLYPIVRATAQLAYAVQFATNKTRPYMKIGIARDLLSTVLVYFLVAPGNWAIPGLGLGALGVAIKTIFAGAITAYALHFTNVRFFKFSLRDQMKKEFWILVSFGFVAGFGLLTGRCLGDDVSPLVRLTVSFLVYNAGILILALTRPQLFTIERFPFRDWYRAMATRNYLKAST